MTTKVLKTEVLLFALLLGACNGPLMTPGQDCQRCHREGGNAQPFSVSGTIFPGSASTDLEGLEGATVLLVDANDQQFALPTNAAGNFYTREDVQLPVAVSVQIGSTTRHMEPLVTYGGCNRCHGLPPKEGADGRAYVHPDTP